MVVDQKQVKGFVGRGENLSESVFLFKSKAYRLFVCRGYNLIKSDVKSES